jgi:hypothetical protein
MNKKSLASTDARLFLFMEGVAAGRKKVPVWYNLIIL